MAENNKPVFVKISTAEKNEQYLVRLDRIIFIIPELTGRRRSAIYVEKYNKGQMHTIALYSSDTVTEIESKILNVLCNE